MDFQEQWQVLVGMLGEGSGAADMFCRILVAMDEDIISLDIPRSQDGVKASMELKVCHTSHVLYLHTSFSFTFSYCVVFTHALH